MGGTSQPIKVIVKAGICGFTTTIEVTTTNKRRLSVKINSDCDLVNSLGKAIKELEQWEALKPKEQSMVYLSASKCSLHSGCLVPCAIIKATEVAAGLALPQDASIHFDNTKQGG